MRPIRSGVRKDRRPPQASIGRAEFKASKGVIKVALKIRRGRIESAQIAGDFFMYPEDMLWKLEDQLVGVEASREEVEKAVLRFYGEEKLETPGVEPSDFVEAIVKAVEDNVNAMNQRDRKRGD